MSKKVFSYHLPKELIATRPPEKRENARLMVVDREKNEIKHLKFRDVIDFLNEGEVLVLNNTKVIPARLFGRKSTGGAVELLLLEKKEPGLWLVLIRGRVREGTQMVFEKISAVVLKRNEDGSWIVRFDAEQDDLFKIGKMPIPPYLKRLPDEKDNFDYQTVYAEKIGSIAAPTAGLHFTTELLNQLKEKGITIVFLTLHIGWASFKLIGDKRKNVPSEFFEIPDETARIINNAMETRRKICAVGTGTVRAIESAFEKEKVVAKKGYTNLFIEPGYRFHCIDKMITNFHLPGSTHLYMVCAFGGTNLIQKAYNEAVNHRYNFYSYGDAMLII
ncbi:MAG: tRNA preQ1(34) S-adenosylmethionine ribosyltransferase-isomerase QueA [Candidatus Omnitrophica bacterium]|nr:tRNA preQ1(34) S-adenosylmethionine ribosyltransferase-isomerase QueA [Candidatus Omnitrophota bacterium]